MFKAITSWFSPKDSSSRRKMTMSSTHDAFSLPTHSPVFPTSTSPYGNNLSSNDIFDSSTAFTYPPSANDDVFGHGLSTNHSATDTSTGSVLPLHRPGSNFSGSYPPLSNSWTRIRAWLSEEYSELGDTLNWGITPESLQEIELSLGFSLPSSVRESYLLTNGQEPESLNGFAEGLFFGLTFLTLEEAFEEWSLWRGVDDDPDTGSNLQLQETMRSVPPGHIRCEYSQRGWFPLITDKAGNFLGVDMNPDQQGTIGQVIVFGRDFDVKVVLSRGDGEGGWGRWLANFAEELESGDGFELGNTDASEGSDDGIGYESYFFDGGGNSRGLGGGLGLRLTGVYRGWPVLESWADQWYRKWADEGAVSIDAFSDRPGKDAAKKLPEPPSPEAAPYDLSDSIPKDSRNVSPENIAESSSPGSKPPLPAPVQLPTAQDIATSPTPSEPASPSTSPKFHRRSYHRFSDSEMAQLNPDSRISVDSDAPKEPNSPTLVDLDTSRASLIPLPPDGDSPIEADGVSNPEAAAVHEEHRVPIPPLVNLSQAPGSADDLLKELPSDAPATVRLVGGGGTAGVLEPEEEEAEAAEGDIEPQVMDSEVSNSLETQTHKRKDSSFSKGLKKLGVTGKRRKDTV